MEDELILLSREERNVGKDGSLKHHGVSEEGK